MTVHCNKYGTDAPEGVADSDTANVNDTYESLIKNSRIMMVDDEPINMEVLQIHLEAEGYSNFISTSDSPGAFELAKVEMPDILLLDLMMPDVDGFDILKKIRSDEQTRQVPIIVLTSSNDPEIKLKALRLRANDFLSKPVDASELALRLRNTLAAQSYQDQLANFDVLTGLPNQKKLLSDLAVLYSALDKRNLVAGLVLVTIDRFKAVNDSMGRDAGDAILRAVGARLNRIFTAYEDSHKLPLDCAPHRIFRVGGDQYAVLLISAADASRVAASVSPFLKLMEEPFFITGREIFVNCSIGAVNFPAPELTLVQLMANAETALVEAKQRRENSFVQYSANMDENARRLSSIENGLRTAIERQELFLNYQPKISVADNSVAGAEALIRWQHPELGAISPEQFIPLAEDNGMIVQIGEWVLKSACKQAVEFRETVSRDFKIAVNVSIRQLYEKKFIDIVNEALFESGLPPAALKLELTENMIMDNAEENITKLNELKAIGVSISIDDFGTGYSSLSYLQKFPLDELKIDQSFIKTISSPLEPAPIVKAIISLAHDLGLTLVAEGVETHHQLARLRALGCEEYQGYLCSKPLSASDFLTAMLALPTSRAA